MKEIELTVEEKLALQSFIYKQLYFESQIQLLKIEYENFIKRLKEKYASLGEIVEINFETGIVKINEINNNLISR